MEGPPEVLSLGRPDREPRRLPWPGPGQVPVGRVAGYLALALVVCLGVLGYAFVQLSHRDHTISGLRAALRTSQDAAAASPGPAAPRYSRTALVQFPDDTGGSFSMVAAELQVATGAGPKTSLFVYGTHATPGARYGLLGDTCGGTYVLPDDWADATADAHGNIRLTAPDVPVDAADTQLWVEVYQLRNGAPLGGVRGPLIGGQPQGFRAKPPC